MIDGLHNIIANYLLKLFNTWYPTNFSDTPIDVIAAYQNYPLPDKRVLVIGYAPTLLSVEGLPVLTEIDDDDEQGIQTPYVAEVEIREVNGRGDLLRFIVSTLGDPRVVEELNSNGVSIQGVIGGVTAVPYVEGDRWKEESVLTLRVAYVDVVTTIDVDWIEETTIRGAVDEREVIID